MTHPRRAETLTDAELEDWGLLALPLAEPLGAPMPTKGLETWSSEDGKTSTGIWECGPGPSRWEMKGEGELIHVVSGRMTCTAEDGTVTEIGPGDSYTFEPGWTGQWDVHETLRKVYAIFPADTATARALIGSEKGGRTLRRVATARSERLPDGLRETVLARLRRANQRLTPNREALLEVLARAGNGPLTIPEILAVRPDLAVSSVYRNLVVLEQANVVHRVVARGDFAYYELVEELTEHHHHVVCSNCGTVEDVPASASIEQSVRDVARQIARRTGFKTERHRLDLFGLCQRCA